MFQHYRVIFRQLVFINSPSYISISIAAVGQSHTSNPNFETPTARTGIAEKKATSNTEKSIHNYNIHSNKGVPEENRKEKNVEQDCEYS